MNRTIAGHEVRALPVAGAFGLLGVSIALAVATGSPWWLVAIGVIAPDLSFLAAIGQAPDAPGLMPRRAVGPYNLVHHPAGPVALLALAAVAGSGPGSVLAISWASHIVWDRAVGYGLRARNGSMIPTRVRVT